MRSVVLCFSGLDPSGGAGLQADIEAIAALGGHAAIVCTALTIQDSQKVYGFQAIDPDFLIAQAERVLADLPVKAIKCGMLANPDIVQVVQTIAERYPHIPLLVDPVLAANSGGSLANSHMVNALTRLFPLATLITPNTLEARWLSQQDDLAATIPYLTSVGAQAILLKGGHEQGQLIKNQLFMQGKLQQTSQWPRLPAEFHGSGCSLAAAIAAGIAQGLSLTTAITRAEVWLHSALQRADYPHPQGQAIPYRVPFSC